MDPLTNNVFKTDFSKYDIWTSMTQHRIRCGEFTPAAESPGQRLLTTVANGWRETLSIIKINTPNRLTRIFYIWSPSATFRNLPKENAGEDADFMLLMNLEDIY